VRPKAIAKQILYQYVPGFRGWFRYWGARVYFPRGSEVFLRACREGTYEVENVRAICAAARADTWFVDVGANIGLLSVAVLGSEKTLHVLSLEPSPNSLGHLRRTWELSPYRERWVIVGKAASARDGSAPLRVGALALGAYDSLVDTDRGGPQSTVQVPLTTLDAEWQALGKPPVTVVKIDVEGCELDVIAGASALISRDRPAIVLEWSAANLQAAGRQPDDLLRVCRGLGYAVAALPGCHLVPNSAILRQQMRRTESFLLVPND